MPDSPTIDNPEIATELTGEERLVLVRVLVAAIEAGNELANIAVDPCDRELLAWQKSAKRLADWAIALGARLPLLGDSDSSVRPD